MSTTEILGLQIHILSSARVDLFKFNNGNTKTISELGSKFWTYFTNCSGVAIVDFEQVNVRWVMTIYANFEQVCDA